MPDELRGHCNMVLKAMLRGDVVPFLGAGVNLCGRPEDAWRLGLQGFLPSGSELAEHLAESVPCPPEVRSDLARVAQLFWAELGNTPLYNDLHGIFDADYRPTTVHEFLATLPSALRAKGYAPRCQLIVTTNYDDVLEQAFRDAGEPFDLVVYKFDLVGQDVACKKGKFFHYPPGLAPVPIDEPNKYAGLPASEDLKGFVRPVILKIHGAVVRSLPGQDSYVITEDDYIDYLAHATLESFLPPTIVGKLRCSNILFLGYGLRDWNVRVILRRLSSERGQVHSWSIQCRPDELDKRFWPLHDVEIVNARLEDYMTCLTTCRGELTTRQTQSR